MPSRPADQVNIAITGWPGVGSTTTTLLLGLLLKRNYIYLGQVFRLLDEKLNPQSDLKLKAQFLEYIQPIVGKTLDSYVDYKLLNSNNLILESDLSTFRLGKHPKTFSIFLKAAPDVRLMRTSVEGRPGIEEDLLKIDTALQEQYKLLWDVDIFDEELIAKKYNLIIDTSKLGILEVAQVALGELQKEFPADYDWQKIAKELPKLVKYYQKNGKDKLRAKLKKAKLLMNAEEIMLDVVKTFPEEVQSFPDEIQKIFLGQS